MKILRMLIFKQKQHWLSFLIPVLILGCALAWGHVYPFGPWSVLIQDMYNQYVQFFNYYYDVFMNGKSLFYSWEAGMGMNFFGIFGYYLSGVFSPIILLFSRGHLPDALVALILVKVGCCGLTMSLYLRKTTGLKEGLTVAFSILYALMSYTIVYFQNIMWIDGVVYLPLVLLGVEYLIKKGRFGLFTIILALSFMSNFYISYMVGAFAFFYFLFRCGVQFGLKDFKTFIVKCGYFIVSGLIAAGLSAIILLPTYYSLMAGASNPKQLHLDLNFSFNLLNFASMLFMGVYDTLKNNGLPEVFVGLLPLMLLPVYFSKKEIALREKILAALFLIFLMVSFEMPTLNMVWHAFDIPNLFPYRYAFVFSFFLLFIAARAYPLLQAKDSRVLFWTFAGMTLLMILLKFVPNHHVIGLNPVVNFLFLALFFVLLLVQLRHSKKWVSFLIVLAVSASMFINASSLLDGIKQDMYSVGINTYKRHYSYLDVYQTIQKHDNGFYRIESFLHGSYNDPFRFQYKGIKHFSSMMDLGLVQSLHHLGYTTYQGKWVSDVGGTLVTDSLLDFKYRVGTKENPGSFGYKKEQSIRNVGIYKNRFALPVGFLTDGVVHSFDVGEDNPFALQNLILNDMVNPNKEKKIHYFRRLVPQKKSSKNVEGASVQYTFNIKGEQQLYMYLPTKGQSESEVFVNGLSMGTYPYTYNNNVLNLGAFQNEKVRVSIHLKSDGSEIKPLLFYGLDIRNFQKGIQYLRKNPFIVDNWTSRSIEGHIHASRAGVLFLSVPYDQGWTIRVDGEKVQPRKALGSFTSIPLTKGKHHIEMSYVPPGFINGAVISAISIIVFVLLLLVNRFVYFDQFRQ